MYKDAIFQAVKSVIFAIGSLGAAIESFMIHTLPVAQWTLAVVGIAAGIASYRASCATHDAIKKAK